jgi:hypothetical protein
VLVHTSLAELPLSRPKPSLVGRHRDLRTQLDHPIVALDDLDLGAGSIEVVAATQIGGQHDLAPTTNPHE